MNHQRYTVTKAQSDETRCGTIPALLRALAVELENSDAMLSSLRIRPAGNAPAMVMNLDRIEWTVCLATETGVYRWPEGKSGSCPTCDGCGGFAPDGSAWGEWSDYDGIRCQTCNGSGYASIDPSADQDLDDEKAQERRWRVE